MRMQEVSYANLTLIICGVYLVVHAIFLAILFKAECFSQIHCSHSVVISCFFLLGLALHNCVQKQ